jgi:hypothetical protein
MPSRVSLIVVAVIATLSLSAVACGDDDSSSSETGDGVGAIAPDPATAFDNFRAAVEGQGMTVTSLPKDQLSGAESGVKITGDKSGTGLVFESQAKAKNYTDSATAKTVTVGTVVFTADTQADADFFASAYEG